jgi:putative transposase
MRRYAISDEPFARIEHLLPGKSSDPGRTAADNRLFIDAVLWIARTGAPWPDLPERFGKYNSVYQRFNRWAKNGVWARIFEELQDPDLEWLMLDSTTVRAHQHAAGARKRGTPQRTPPHARGSAGAGAG